MTALKRDYKTSFICIKLPKKEKEMWDLCAKELDMKMCRLIRNGLLEGIEKNTVAELSPRDDIIRINIRVNDNEKKLIHEKASALGLTITMYSRICASVKCNYILKELRDANIID